MPTQVPYVACGPVSFVHIQHNYLSMIASFNSGGFIYYMCFNFGCVGELIIRHLDTYYCITLVTYPYRGWGS